MGTKKIPSKHDARRTRLLFWESKRKQTAHLDYVSRHRLVRGFGDGIGMKQNDKPNDDDFFVTSIGEKLSMVAMSVFLTLLVIGLFLNIVT